MGEDRRWLLPPHLDLHLEVFVPKKKEIAAAAGGWGSHRIPSAGLNGWMEKASRSQHPLLYVIHVIHVICNPALYVA
jgi:hypothetical protein